MRGPRGRLEKLHPDRGDLKTMRSRLRAGRYLTPRAYRVTELVPSSHAASQDEDVSEARASENLGRGVQTSARPANRNDFLLSKRLELREPFAKFAQAFSSCASAIDGSWLATPRSSRVHHGWSLLGTR
jgi:hypothetical protein